MISKKKLVEIRARAEKASPGSSDGCRSDNISEDATGDCRAIARYKKDVPTLCEALLEAMELLSRFTDEDFEEENRCLKQWHEGE